MKIEEAKEIQLTLNNIEKIAKNIKWLSEKERVLCFGSLYGSGCNKEIHAYVDQYNEAFMEILDKHHKMIINELEEKKSELLNRIQEL